MSMKVLKFIVQLAEDDRRCSSSMWLEEYLCLLYFRNFKPREVTSSPIGVCLTSSCLSKVEVNVAHP